MEALDSRTPSPKTTKQNNPHTTKQHQDVAFADSRIRGETIAAEDVLHDMGAISILSSDRFVFVYLIKKKKKV